MSDEFDFSDLTIKEYPVTAPDGEKYILREADTAAAKAYRNAQSNIYKVDEDGKIIGLNNPADLQPLLVSLCLFTPDGAKVGLDVIDKWPGRMTKRLFDRAHEISELDASPEASAIQAAFKRDDAPCSLPELRKWAEKLDEEDKGKEAKDRKYRPFTLMLIEVEEKAKNE